MWIDLWNLRSKKGHLLWVEALFSSSERNRIPGLWQLQKLMVARPLVGSPHGIFSEHLWDDLLGLFKGRGSAVSINCLPSLHSKPGHRDLSVVGKERGLRTWSLDHPMTTMTCHFLIFVHQWMWVLLPIENWPLSLRISLPFPLPLPSPSSLPPLISLPPSSC